MKANKNNKCAYCGNDLEVTSNIEIEHIAPKGGSVRPKYVEFTFEIVNLVLACHLCNLPIKKGTYDTIDIYNPEYEKCKFKIVHPYLDNIDDHFDFVEDYSVDGVWGIIIQPKTEKAKESVRLFKLNENPQIINRCVTKLYEKENLNRVRRTQIDNVLTYKPSL